MDEWFKEAILQGYALKGTIDMRLLMKDCTYYVLNAPKNLDSRMVAMHWESSYSEQYSTFIAH
ncbi:hypothetical protein CR513_22406, partial [Mucuna pruriens]